MLGSTVFRCVRSGGLSGLDSSECVSQVSVSLWSDGDDGGFRIHMSLSLTACVCVCVFSERRHLLCFLSCAYVD